MSRKGWLVLLIRLTPVLPFNVLNYALGLSSIVWYQYTFYSWIGMMPGTLLYIYIGWAAVGAVQSASGGTTSLLKVKSKRNFVLLLNFFLNKKKANFFLLKDILLYGVGSLATIILVVVITIVAKRTIAKTMAEMEEEDISAKQKKPLLE